MFHPGTGPSFSNAGGEPPEYEWQCFSCQNKDIYDYEPTEEELWEESEDPFWWEGDEIDVDF
jgi:hypothetical protein